ncbi:hypothetical protein Ancab_032273, partial [Ancistrocladus abbreviatus]
LRMEDGVTEIESRRLLQFPPTPQQDREHHDDGKTRQADGSGGRETTADGNGNSTESNKEDDENPEILKEEKREAKRGGLLDLLVSPRCSKPIDVEVFQVDETTHDDDSGSGATTGSGESGGTDGGVINNLISNILFHQNVGETVSGERRREGVGEEVEQVMGRVEAEVEEGGASSFVDNIISHLLPSIPDNVAPEADEASILIHSIVHD